MKTILFMILLIASPLTAQSIEDPDDLQTELENCLQGITAKVTEKSLVSLKSLINTLTPDAVYGGIELQLILCYAFETIDSTAREAVEIAVKPVLEERDVWRGVAVVGVIVAAIEFGILIFGK